MVLKEVRSAEVFINFATVTDIRTILILLPRLFFFLEGGGDISQGFPPCMKPCWLPDQCFLD